MVRFYHEGICKNVMRNWTNGTQPRFSARTAAQKKTVPDFSSGTVLISFVAPEKTAGVYFAETTITSNAMYAPPGMPACGIPREPYASSGGMTILRVSPTFMSCT